MHKAAGGAVADGGGDVAAGDGGGEGEVAAGEAFAQGEDVGHHISVFEREQFTGAAEAGGDFVENQQHTVSIAQAAGAAQVFGVIEIHAARALHDGFKNQRGEAVGLFGKQDFQRAGGVGRPLVVKTAFGLRQEILHRQAAAKQAVHTGFGVAYRHGMPSVAVVAGADGGELVFAGEAFGLLVLQRHFHRHFHRHRAAVGKKDFIETGG